ncbi:NnrS family protein [Thalassotalea sp. PP2-459]|uniref:NnrS family protein n=1 Tax=Thalassotalea sp. PP2-459 TaxID=1742724 RepID=UPI0009FB1638|nr:NnrS family protein [Thalassotalea sp. PP2-459]
MMQITDLAQEEKLPPILRLGFRPFFLLGPAFAIIALTLWLLIFYGKINLQPFASGYWWHIHEMIFGFAAAIIAGFLLTAVQTWTGIRSVHGNALFWLIILWLAGRIALLLPTYLPHIMITIIDLSFLPVAAYMLAKPIIAVKQKRNLFFVPLLLMFTLVNGQMHLAFYQGDNTSVQLSGYAGIMLITMLISIIGGRVTPMFTANGSKTEKVANLPWLEISANITLFTIFILYFISPILNLSQQTFGMLFVIAGTLQAYRITRWRPWVTFKIPLLWSLHLALFCIWMALLLLGLSYLFNLFPTNHLWHLLTIGGISGVILAMIARVSLGHTGRPLVVGKLIKFSFLLIFIAAFTRAILPILAPAMTPTFYWLATGFACASFLLFLYRYIPYLIQQRIDGRPG